MCGGLRGELQLGQRMVLTLAPGDGTMRGEMGQERIQVNLRLPVELHERLVRVWQAERDRGAPHSRNGLIVRAVRIEVNRLERELEDV